MTKRILYIDDEAPIRRAFARSVRDVGVDIDLAADCAQAIALAQKNEYAVIVTDLHMPDHSGLEVIVALEPLQPRAIFLVVTGADDLDLPQDSPEARLISQVIFKPWDIHELSGTIRRSLDLYQTQDSRPSDADLRKSDTVQQHITQVSHFDSLTGLANQALLQERLEDALTAAKVNNGQVGLLLLELDHFEEIHDTLGPALGDQLLKEVASRLRGTLIDLPTIARLSAAQFAVVLCNPHQEALAEPTARLILQRLAKPFAVDEQEVLVTACVGISTYPSSDRDVERMIKDAQSALFQAKSLGRNHYILHSPEMNKVAAKRLTLESKLGLALERQEFQLFYQPVIDITTGLAIGAEALLRWFHPERGMISPADFIPSLEETGLIVPVGRWLTETACRQLRKWSDNGLPNLRVAINISARQFREDDLASSTYEAIHASGVSPGRVEFEITETALLHRADATSRALHDMRAMGLTIALDDFGTGYSSLSFLKRFPIDTLKIDRSFVRDIATDRDGAAITCAIVDLAKALRLNVIAEGVETFEQQELLKRQKCNLQQGYLYSRPLPADAFQSWLLEQKALRGAA
ncbi:MAG: EAL domain-containing protein [Myxococcota bacterium]